MSLRQINFIFMRCFMLFCVAKSYSKDGDLRFFPICVFEVQSYKNSYEQFLSMRFYQSGSYRLFELKPRSFGTDVCSCFNLDNFKIKTCLYSRIFRWTEDGNFISNSFFGFYPDNPKDGDPEVIFKALSSGDSTPFTSNDSCDTVPPEVF